MSSTFFGLTISASGLNTANAQINTTANNISNVNTDGYSKQVVNTVASSALRCYSSYGTTGTGVEATSVTQCRDLYYDEKYWNNQSDLGYYEKKQYFMDQIENYFSETNKTDGFTTIYTEMFNSMSTLQTNAGDETVRKQFIADAKELCNYFNDLSTKLSDLQSSINDEIKTAVDEINAMAEKIAILNKQINTIEQGGGTANELRDQRALIIDELSEYSTVECNEVEVKNSNYPDMDTGATYFTVKLAGQLLVDTYEYNTLAVKARDTDASYNQCDVSGLYDIVWEKDGVDFNPCTESNTGSLKAMFEVRDGNNSENMKGTVSSTDISSTTNSDGTTSTNYSITITGLNSINSILNNLNLSSSGVITVNNKVYKYDSFEVTTAGYNEDDDEASGAITSVTFNLDPDDPNVSTFQDDSVNMISKELVAGESVDFMGIPYYQNQMNEFLRNFCEAFNHLEEEGVTLEDDVKKENMKAFFIAQDKTDNSIEYNMTSEIGTTVDDNKNTVEYENDFTDEDGNKYTLSYNYENNSWIYTDSDDNTYTKKYDSDSSSWGDVTGVDKDGNEITTIDESITKLFPDYLMDESKYNKTFTSDLSDDTFGVSSNFYYLLTASSIAINAESDNNSKYFSTSVDSSLGQDAADVVDELLKLQSDTEIFRGSGGSSFLQCIYADVTVDTQECDIFVTNFTNIQSTIEQQRLSVSGVDEDEEALDLIKFQNAYNLASKCISVFTEIYDRLILETGV